MAVRIVLKHSATEDKRPTPGQLENGEIALNYNAAGAFLTCKDTDGNIQQVAGVKITETAPGTPVKGTQWFQPSSMTLFIYDGSIFQAVMGGDGSGGGGDVTSVNGKQGVVVLTASDVGALAPGDDISELINDAGYITIGDLPPEMVYTGESGIDVTGNEISLDIEGQGLEINVNDKLQASIATDTTLGVVKAGSGIGITADGTISANTDVTVDLGYTPATDQGTVTNDAGDDAVIPLADTTNAGLFTAAEKSKLAGIEDNATNESTNDGRYLRKDAAAGDQTVASTGTTTFDGGLTVATKDALINGVTVGRGTGSANSTNTAVGSDALGANTTAFENTAIGSQALYSNINGSYNTANGSLALYSNIDGRFNTANGHGALYSNTEGVDNNAFGRLALNDNTSGNDNTAVGSTALLFNTTGNENTAIGSQALYFNDIGNNNTAVGYKGGYFKQDSTQATDFSNCSYLGYDTRASASNQVQLGNSFTTTFAYGAVQDRSDARDKTDIRDTLLGLDFIKSLRPVDFRWDMRDDYFDKEEYQEDVLRTRQVLNPDYVPGSDEPELINEEYTETVTKERLVAVPKDGSRGRDRFHHGLIAQEVKAAADAHGVDFAGYQDHSINGGLDVLSIGYTEMIAPLIKAVQELSAENAELKSRLDALEAAATS